MGRKVNRYERLWMEGGSSEESTIVLKLEIIFFSPLIHRDCKFIGYGYGEFKD